LRLYAYWRSSASWRVRIGLALKGLDVEIVPVNLLDGAQRGSAHRARNPMGQVPVLELDDGTLLMQSLAILEYIDEVFPGPRLLPEEPLARSRARELAEIVNAGVQPLQNLRVLGAVDALGGDRADWARDFIHAGLVALEARAQVTAGDFLVGDAPSIADLCLVPQLYNARRFRLPLDPFPKLRDVEARCEALPAFQAAHPSRQPDAT
jgi:maleylpyruvate isomerase